MGVLDFRKTWNFSVAASAEQCFRAFYQAMSAKGMGVGAIKWRVDRTSARSGPDPAQPEWPAYVATFTGRAGLGGIMSVSSAGRAMVGTQITFGVNPETAGGRTECSMWMSNRLSGMQMPMGDLLFLRNYMNEVEKQLRLLDPGLLVERV